MSLWLGSTAAWLTGGTACPGCGRGADCLDCGGIRLWRVGGPSVFRLQQIIIKHLKDLKNVGKFVKDFIVRAEMFPKLSYEILTNLSD